MLNFGGVPNMFISFVPQSKLLILGMVIPPLIGILIMGIKKTYYKIYKVDDHPYHRKTMGA